MNQLIFLAAATSRNTTAACLPARPLALHHTLALTSVQHHHHTHAAAGDDDPHAGEGLGCSAQQFLYEGTKKKDDSLQGRGRERDTFTSPGVSPITELGQAEQAAGRRAGRPSGPRAPFYPVEKGALGGEGCEEEEEERRGERRIAGGRRGG